MTVLVTGAAGFIGSYICAALLERGEHVVGVDNLNAYYDVRLKQYRLAKLENGAHGNAFDFYHLDISDREAMTNLAHSHAPTLTHIVHLAAQAGVRYSLEQPFAYLESNLAGQLVMLELCRNLPNLRHFVYASSSSVYGNNTPAPFAVEARTDAPASLYAATKKAGELMAHSYSHLYSIPATGLRFFTVYGAAGRPDMAYFLFTQAILEGTPVRLFNRGEMKRDFTYIDDIVAGTLACLDTPRGGHRVYNLGNNNPVELQRFLAVLESSLGKKARIEEADMQPGDVYETCADITASTRDFGFAPRTPIEDGLPRFVAWYRDYYRI